MKEGDIVRLSKDGKDTYDDARYNPHDSLGVVTSYKAHDWTGHKITVKWDTGEKNTYKPEDLELVEDVEEESGEYTGGSSSYYDVEVNGTQIRCLDIIEALQMNYAEGNAFKAVWRIAAAKQGKLKKGNTMLYDAEKIAFFGERMVTEHG